MIWDREFLFVHYDISIWWDREFHSLILMLPFWSVWSSWSICRICLSGPSVCRVYTVIKGQDRYVFQWWSLKVGKSLEMSGNDPKWSVNGSFPIYTIFCNNARNWNLLFLRLAFWFLLIVIEDTWHTNISGVINFKILFFPYFFTYRDFTGKMKSVNMNHEVYI